MRIEDRNSQRLFTLGACLAVALCAGGCATRPTVYKAPDASRVIATTKRLSAAIARQAETTIRVEAKAQEAQQSSDRIATHSATVINQVDELAKVLPIEFQPQVAQLRAAVDAQIVEEGKLSASLAGMRGEIEQLKSDNAAVVKEKNQLLLDQARYQSDAKRIADAATEESRQKVEYQKQLTSQKIFGLLWKLGGGVVLVGVLVLGFLWFTGRIAISAAKIVS